MRFQAGIYLAISVVIITIVCSCSADAPITPDPTINEISATRSISHNLWGFWEILLEPDAGCTEIIPFRQCQFHLNITNWLQDPLPNAIEIEINSFNSGTRTASLSISISHPLPDSDFRGFDVRGIVFGVGSSQSAVSDSGICYASPDAFRLIDADGYTRWWNPSEFTSSGLFGFTEGHLGSPGFVTDLTLNGYKVYSDSLDQDDPVVPGLDPENRGTFSSDIGTSLTRNFILRFPEIDGLPSYRFQYAIDCSWASPTGSSATPKPVDDFPIEANCEEAFYIDCDTSGSTAYYYNDVISGGTLNLDLSIYDWQGLTNPAGVSGEIESIIIESATLFGEPVIIGGIDGINTSDICANYKVQIPDVTPSHWENQEILITVVSNPPASYAPPYGISEYPIDADLAAYKVISIPVFWDGKIYESEPNDEFENADKVYMGLMHIGTLCDGDTEDDWYFAVSESTEIEFNLYPEPIVEDEFSWVLSDGVNIIDFKFGQNEPCIKYWDLEPGQYKLSLLATPGSCYEYMFLIFDPD